MKSYTTTEQSRKLAEILPLESADMWYQYTGISIKDGSEKPVYFPMVIRDCESDEDIPCWSLAALLSILDFPSLTQINENEWEVCVFNHDNDGYIEKIASNPVDVCVEMILKLHELKML